jgi:rhodanese-related sulfurtransferase
MPTTVKELLAAANAAVPRLTLDQARALLAKGGVLVVDVRDTAEVAQSGKLKGAVNVSRGMLEFRADPESPYYNAAFRKDQPVAVYCASGGRSALSGKTLKDLGYGTVYNLGGFKELAEAGAETEPASAGG